jgi:hypothetical protein
MRALHAKRSQQAQHIVRQRVERVWARGYLAAAVTARVVTQDAVAGTERRDLRLPHFQTGGQLAGRPSIGSWLSYGLGSMNQDLPAFVAMVSQGSGNPNDQPLYDRLWGSGFLPSRHQGVKFRSVGDPVLYLSNPPGITRGGDNDYFRFRTRVAQYFFSLPRRVQLGLVQSALSRSLRFVDNGLSLFLRSGQDFFGKLSSLRH